MAEMLREDMANASDEEVPVTASPARSSSDGIDPSLSLGFLASGKNKRQRHNTSEILRNIPSTGEITDDNVRQLYMILEPVCEGCPENSKDNPNCFCGLVPKQKGHRKTGLWQPKTQIQHGPNQANNLRPDNSPTGLKNLGQTCATNCLLQCLYMNKLFRKGVFSVEQHVLTQERPLGELARIFAELQANERDFVNPGRFIEILKEKINVAHNSQQDIAEIFDWILSMLEKCFSHSTKTVTIVQDLFRGHMSYVTRCSKCGEESEASSKTEDFCVLILRIDGLKSLDESLNDYLNVEELHGENQYFCESCQTGVDATRSLKLRTLPDVLHFQLMRSDFIPETGTKKRITSTFSFPGKLDMGHRLSEPFHMVYDLSAVLIHEGTSEGGHYTAHIKDEDTGQWWKFDDTHVSKVGAESVGATANGNHIDAAKLHSSDSSSDRQVESFSSNDAYMLVYKRRHVNGSNVSDNVLLPSHLYEDIKKRKLKVIKERKKEVRDVLSQAPIRSPDEQYYWISTKWLRQWADSISQCPIDNKPIQCRHNKVPASNVRCMKRLSAKAWKMLHDKYGGGPPLGNSDYCSGCLIDGVRAPHQEEDFTPMDRRRKCSKTKRVTKKHVDRFSTAELEELILLVNLHGFSWTLIKKESVVIKGHRTANQLRDKWKAMYSSRHVPYSDRRGDAKIDDDIMKKVCKVHEKHTRKETQNSSLSSMSDDLLAKTILQVVTKHDMSRTNIQTIGALSRALGYRFGPHLADTVPALINYCTSASENDEELREYSLQALESFLLSCPQDMFSYCDKVLHLNLEYLSYDPNFTAKMEEDTDEEDDEYAASVRRAAAKCLAALIVSQPEMLSKLYEKACTKLIDRFTEREENVKMDVFNTFIELLRQTGNNMKGQNDVDELSPRWLLNQEVSKVVKSLDRQLCEKSIKTKVGAFAVLKELVVVLPGCLPDHIGSLITGIEKALSDKSSTSNLKIEALVFARLVLSSHSPSLFHPYIKALSSPVLSAVGERHYKVTAEALRLCGELVHVMRPEIDNFGFDFKPYVHPIYNAIISCLTNQDQDQDQEVKECAISCMGLVVSTFGDNLVAELPSCLPVLLDRMRNEITRLTAVKAFAVIADSPLRIDLSCVLEHVITELTASLRKANRALREATFGILNSLIVAYGDKIGSSAYEVIIVELSALISDSDLHMTFLAIELCCTLIAVRSSPNVGLAVRNEVLPQALNLVKSSLLQGQALQGLQNFFAAMVDTSNITFDALLDSLLSCAKSTPQLGGIAEKALHSIAHCVSVLCLAAENSNCKSTVRMLADILKDNSINNWAKQIFALLCLGEIGKEKDLSSHQHIENIVIKSFQSPFEMIKSAASYALGNIAVGNLSEYLPIILDQIDNPQIKQHLLIHSLKEVIVSQSVDKSKFEDSSVEKILGLLFDHCESEEEDVRNEVAECLGKIALIEPAKLVPALKVRTTSSAAFTRATVVIAVKYSLVERSAKIDEIVYPEISSFLMLIKDQDRHVSRAAVLALSTAAHNKPNLIKGLLPELLPFLYDQTIIKKELVSLGPFKQVADDGLGLRKAAFECVDTLLDSCLDQLDPPSFIIPYLKSGLEDHYDVKMSCHLILSKLAVKCPSAVLAVLDSLVDALQKTISFKPEQDAVEQEVDRNEDMIRSVLRAIASLSRISGVDCIRRFKNLISKLSKSPTLRDTYQSIRNE